MNDDISLDLRNEQAIRNAHNRWLEPPVEPQDTLPDGSLLDDED